MVKSQDVTGEWYGWANFDDYPDENNYMISFNLNQKGEQVNGEMSIYYMNEFRKFSILGVVDRETQTFLITHLDIPVHFLGLGKFGKVDIDMFLNSKIINYRSGNQLKGHLISKTYRTIKNINFILMRPEEIVETKFEQETSLITSTSLTSKKILIKDDITIPSDSVTLSLYDGSIIDSDTVSVIINGKTIVDKVLLSDKPLVLKLKLNELGSSLLVVLQAENLGSIPPNTGIMIVEAIGYRKVLYFSGNLTVSSGFILQKGAR